MFKSDATTFSTQFQSFTVKLSLNVYPYGRFAALLFGCITL